MSIPYPDKPWEDKQFFSYQANDGSKVTGIYNSSKNAWTFSRSMELADGGGSTPGGVVTTVDVRTVGQRPDDPNVSPFSTDPSTIGTQRDINWWLYDRVIELDESLANVNVSRLRGEWKYSNGPLVEGVFQQFNGDSHEQYFINVEKIVFSKFDSLGVSHDFDNVGEGDLIEILSTVGEDYGLFVVVSVNDIGTGVEIEVAHDRSIGLMPFNGTAKIKIFNTDSIPDRPPIISDTAPDEHPSFPGFPLEEGDFWYSTNLLELYIWYNDAWFPTALPASGVSEETFTYSINRINSIIEEVYLKNINQDNRLDTLEENIVELEEEIDAIAPSNERGEWNFNPAGIASPGYYAFLDGSTQPTDRFDGAATIYVSTRDADSVTHSFNNHQAGEYLQIFNKEGDGYGLYQITDIDDNSSSPNPFFAFTVDFVRSLVTVPKAAGRGRFKFFSIADGDPEAYVLKTGDEMEGNLKFKNNFQVQTRYINSGQDSNLSIQRKGETKILVGSENVQLQKPIKFVESSFATADEHAIHKGYVDEKYAELLAKIEELEMASGGAENYRLRLQTRNYGSSSNIGDWLEFNSCFTSVTAPSAWKNLDIDAVSGQDGYFYVCFPDDTYSMNSSGTLHVAKEFDGSYSFYDSDRHVLKLAVSNAEKCPDEYSNNKNIWRCNIQPDFYRTSYNESTLGAFSDREYLYVTFGGGSLTKVTP